MPYAPGIQYRGDQYLFQGVSQGLQGVEGLIAGLVDRHRQSDAADKMIEAMFPKDSDQLKTYKSMQKGLSLEGKMSFIKGSLASQDIASKQAQIDQLVQSTKAQTFQNDQAQKVSELIKSFNPDKTRISGYSSGQEPTAFLNQYTEGPQPDPVDVEVPNIQPQPQIDVSQYLPAGGPTNRFNLLADGRYLPGRSPVTPNDVSGQIGAYLDKQVPFSSAGTPATRKVSAPVQGPGLPVASQDEVQAQGPVNETPNIEKVPNVELLHDITMKGVKAGLTPENLARLQQSAVESMKPEAPVLSAKRIEGAPLSLAIYKTDPLTGRTEVTGTTTTFPNLEDFRKKIIPNMYGPGVSGIAPKDVTPQDIDTIASTKRVLGTFQKLEDILDLPPTMNLLEIKKRQAAVKPIIENIINDQKIIKFGEGVLKKFEDVKIEASSPNPTDIFQIKSITREFLKSQINVTKQRLQETMDQLGATRVDNSELAPLGIFIGSSGGQQVQTGNQLAPKVIGSIAGKSMKFTPANVK